jgi:uncharacterized protein Yka (UPF0111/DUF47 family)
MFRNLLPKEVNFFEFFQEHIELTIKLANEIDEIFKNPSIIEEKLEQIRKYEKKLDGIEVNCIEALHRTFITPFERTEIYKLIKKLDDIADALNGALSRIHLYDIKEIKPEVLQLTEIIKYSLYDIKELISLIEDMKEIDKIRTLCDSVRKKETEGDKIYRNTIKNLFNSDNAVEIIKWKDVIDRVERSLDRCQDVANIVEEITIDNA